MSSIKDNEGLDPQYDHLSEKIEYDDNEKEYQKYAEKMAAWDRFKQEVRILKIYKFESRQLIEYIRLEYERK